MGKRVGLISFHFLHNYGTMLQAYALQRKIEDLGYEAEYIDYRLGEARNTPLKLLMIRLKRMGVYLFHYKKYVTKAAFVKKMSIRKDYYMEFYKSYIHTGSHKYDTLAELIEQPPQYDIYMVGSDQVWNPNVTSKRPVYYLCFVNDNQKTASYAPSIGVTMLTPGQEEQLAQRIKHIRFLSCREKTGAELLEKIMGRKVEHVLDPTLLLDQAVWGEIAVKPTIQEPYICCYFLGDAPHCREFAEDLQRRTGLKAYYIACSPLDMRKKTAIFYAGPAEFLGLIQNAKYVCTDSFHGTVFSINFRKDFFSFCKRKNSDPTSDNSRIVEILKYMGLESRLITKGNIDSIDDYKIDYQAVESRLEAIRENSVKYLWDVLSQAGG